MKLVIDKKYWIEQVSLVFILFMGLFSNYIEYSSVWNILLFVNFFLLVFLSKKFRMKLLDKGIIGWFLTLIVFIVININFTENFNSKYFVDNMLKLFKTYLVCLIIVVIVEENPQYFISKIFNNKKLFNFIWIINLVVLTIQTNGIPLFIKSKWLISNKYYEDNCTGLFGFSGTHILTFFAMFIFILNYLDNYKSVTNSKKHKWFNVITVIWMLIIATKNDNVTIFILYVFFYLLIRIVESIYKNENVSKKIIRTFNLLIIIVVLLPMIYSIPTIKSFIDNVLIKKISSTVFFENSYINGSNERLAIAYKALEEKIGWKFGLGLGSSFWVSNQSFYEFEHFGLSSIGSFIYLGGIWFYLFITLMYIYMFFKVWHIEMKPTTSYVVLLSFFMIFVSSYSTIYTFSLTMIWLTMCMTLIHNFNLKG